MRLKTSSAENRKASQQAAQFGLRRAGRDVAEIVENAGVGIEFLVLVLREVIGLDIVAQLVLAPGERLSLSQQLNQRGLAGAVHSDQRDPVAALDHEIDVAEDLLFAVGFRDLR